MSALLAKGKKHVPYRNSKLTRMLQDSLGGNTRTMFVVTVSPASVSTDETLSTLQFATRAMRVQTFATTNEAIDGNLLQRYENEIARLRALLRASNAGGPKAALQLGGKWDEPQGAGETPNLEDQMSGQMAVDLEAMRDENLRLLQVGHTGVLRFAAAMLPF